MSLETLKNAGFVIRKRKEQKYLSNIFQKRYQHIPLEYSHFLQSFKSIQNQDDDVWFVSIEDFNETSKNDFKWNEFELISLEACENEEEIDQVRSFWDRHIPILISVKDEYEYLALCVDEQNFGVIVHGMEPEFEEVSKVSESFKELIIMFQKPSACTYVKRFIE